MKQAIVFTLFCSISLVLGQNGYSHGFPQRKAVAVPAGPGATVKVEPVERGTGTRLAVPGHGPAVTSPASTLQPLPPDSGWTLIDSLVLHSMIPAGDRVAVVFDSATQSLRDTLLPDFLTDSSKMAVGQERDATNHPGRDSFIGEIARILFWERPLTDAELAETLDALRKEYGIK